VIILRRKYLLDSERSKDFGTIRHLEMHKITLIYSVLSLCPMFERNLVMMLGLHLQDFCC